MIEPGTAHIDNNGGFIDSATGPTPVGFLPASWSLVNNGDAVHFERSSTDPYWAIRVAPDSRVAALTRSVNQVPLTVGAAKLLTETSVRFVVEAQAAPTTSQSESHLKAKSEKLKAMLSDRPAATRKLDTRSLGKALKKV